MNKKCAKCKQEKDTSCFSKYVRNGGFQAWCKECVAKADKIRYQCIEVKQKFIARNKQRRIVCRKKIYEYLQTHPCVDCGETDPIVLEFDHLRDKIENISDLANRKSWKDVLKEIEKCEVVCANCHLRRTAKQFNWYKYVGVKC